MRQSLALAAAALALAAVPATPAPAGELFGVTVPSGGTAFFVSINLATGQATGLFSFAVPMGFSTGTMAYHGPTGQFVVLSSATTGSPPSRLIIIDHVAQTANFFPVSGLPAGEEKVGGIEYRGNFDELLLTFGPTGGSTENRIARVRLDGQIEAASPNLGLGDTDVLGFNAVTGQLLGGDFNATDGLPPVAAISNVFTAPSFVRFANPPFDNTIGDMAVDPNTGRVYLISFGPGGGTLKELVGDTYATVGLFNVAIPLIGLAFIPEPCSADFDDSGAVDISDLLALLSQWGACPGCLEDLDGSGTVDIQDLLQLLSEWGGCA